MLSEYPEDFEPTEAEDEMPEHDPEFEDESVESEDSTDG